MAKLLQLINAQSGRLGPHEDDSALQSSPTHAGLDGADSGQQAVQALLFGRSSKWAWLRS